jgi:hypothetical protein
MKTSFLDTRWQQSVLDEPLVLLSIIARHQEAATIFAADDLTNLGADVPPLDRFGKLEKSNRYH